MKQIFETEESCKCFSLFLNKTDFKLTLKALSFDPLSSLQLGSVSS